MDERNEEPEAPDARRLMPDAFELIRFCGRCGRRLYGPAAIARGYGPRCWEIVTGQKPPRPRALHIKHATLLQTTERS